ncbi:Salutaridinol 7-O-acetyltransferase [Actinidia chinensis var. chinensis]|uniref:Salutaridinol 7-O-acetyltransferase n=1 Tax=Actinidia chinensis var. chinensis TaxID=1590841 RepID=A0A2R6Q1E5_ACTCC|nr:Salutaridinol 7-O-acetyltransferase [Actinidia chinensis var. chinensis]
MEVVVTSRETIKPSSPTPNHLRRLQLCFFDQINRPIFTPFVYFYAAESPGDRTNHHRRSEQLKKSLADTLSVFYPLAGRVIDEIYVECSDKGVDFFQAQVNCELCDIIGSNAKFGDQLNKLIPYQETDAGDLTIGIQVNFFECGGICIAACFSHKVSDALSFLTFFNSWAAAASCGDLSKVVRPRFGLADLFPPEDIPRYHQLEEKDSIAQRTFVFSESAISALKAKLGTNKCTRVEALSAFIWSRFIAATSKKSPKRHYRVFHSVNLRPRLDQTSSEYYFGNLVGVATVIPPSTKELVESEFVRQLREALRKVDGAYVKNLQRPGLDVNFFQKRGKEEDEEVRFSFTSLSRFQLYEADFGWGKPIWVTLGKHSNSWKNTALFFPTPSGDGIEVILCLEEEDMVQLEADKHFQAFVSPTSTPKPLFLISSSL